MITAPSPLPLAVCSWLGFTRYRAYLHRPQDGTVSPDDGLVILIVTFLHHFLRTIQAKVWRDRDHRDHLISSLHFTDERRACGCSNLSRMTQQVNDLQIAEEYAKMSNILGIIMYGYSGIRKTLKTHSNCLIIVRSQNFFVHHSLAWYCTYN